MLNDIKSQNGVDEFERQRGVRYKNKVFSDFIRQRGIRYRDCRLSNFKIECDARRKAVERISIWARDIRSRFEAGNGAVLLAPSEAERII